MRTGLALLGAAIAVIGGGLIITLFFLSGGSTTATQLTFENPDLASHGVSTYVISHSTTSSSSIGISWSSSAPVNVTLTPAAACLEPLGVCPIGPAVFNWSMALSGKGGPVAANASAYILEVVNPGGVALKFSAVVSVAYHPGAPLPDWAWGLIALGGVTLLGIGGIAVFLGLFLPGGVYQGGANDVMQGRPPAGDPGPGPDEPYR